MAVVSNTDDGVFIHIIDDEKSAAVSRLVFAVQLERSAHKRLAARVLLSDEL